MKNTNKNRAANPQQKSEYLDRVVVLINRIQGNQTRCLKDVEKVMERVQSIEGDIETIAREVARQAELARTDSSTQ